MPRFPGRKTLAVLLMLATLVGALASSAANSPEILHTYSFLTGVTATVGADGSLVVSTGPGATVLLTTDVVPLSVGHRVRDDKRPPFSIVVAEGSPGGQRGFSAHCDDDDDGAVDEDPLDGHDNDGDGRIDEDFAAISDAMVVVHQDGLRGGARASHLEYYHWAYPHLRSTLFLAAQGSPGLANGGTYRLVLGDHNWQEATLVSARHSLAGKAEPGRTEAYIAQPLRPSAGTGDSPCGDESGLWVGVVKLAAAPGSSAALAGGVLEMPLGEEPLYLAVCVAESWLQLNSMLNETVRVQRGAVDKITGRQAPWIVPPLCARCRLSPVPDFSFSQAATGELVLSAKIRPERGVALDPDLFQVAGRALGAPQEVRWQPVAGPAASVAWTCMNSAMLDGPHDRLSDPYGHFPDLLSHQAAGRLSFVFAGGPQISIHDGDRLEGRYLDGRPFEAALREKTPDPLPEVEAGETPGPARLPKGKDRPMTLSPKLLEGFPNPFRDHIQLSFAVPATVGEAFVWGDDQDPPSGVNLQAAVPWQGGTPNASVKIYSLNGQELVTLFAASLGPGENMVQWDGTDRHGRQVASGTYFCKLQLDQWSVTRRLVYLR